MEDRSCSRRNFLQTSAVGTAALTMAMPGRVLGANEKVRLGWIGCGGRGTYMLQRALTVDDIEVVAICDLIQQRVERGASVVEESREKKIPTYLDFRQMLDKEKMDGVVAITEVGNHGKVVIPILETDLHCFSEKPMDATVEMVDAITIAARKSKGIYQLGFQRRSDAGYRAGVEAIHKGDIGEVIFMQGQWHWYNGPCIGGWVGNVDMSGGKLNEQACHHMDLMSWVMKNTAPVKCLAVAAITCDYEKPNRHQAENVSSVSWWWPNGAILSYTHLHGISHEFEGEKSWAMGTKGGVDLLKGELYPREGEKRRVTDQDPGWGDPASRAEMVEFVDCIRTGKVPTSNHETGRISTLMTLMAAKAMYRRDQNSYGPGMISWDEIGSIS